ncbi:MAG: helix-turn-helix transcriptional regulator [Candidatus Binatia bacterium]
MHDGNLHYALLGLLACHEQGAHGYRLKNEAEALCENDRQVNYGRVYRALDALERSGDINGRAEIQNGRPNRKIYRLTGKGHDTVRTWLAGPASGPAYPLRDELALKLCLLGNADLSEVAELVGRHRTECIERLERLTRQRSVLRRAGLDRTVGELVADAAETRIRAELGWLEQLARRFIRRAAG